MGHLKLTHFKKLVAVMLLMWGFPWPLATGGSRTGRLPSTWPEDAS